MARENVICLIVNQKKKKSIVLEDKVEEISKNRECVKKPSKL